MGHLKRIFKILNNQQGTCPHSEGTGSWRAQQHQMLTLWLLSFGEMVGKVGEEDYGEGPGCQGTR